MEGVVAGTLRRGAQSSRHTFGLFDAGNPVGGNTSLRMGWGTKEVMSPAVVGRGAEGIPARCVDERDDGVFLAVVEALVEVSFPEDASATKGLSSWGSGMVQYRGRVCGGGDVNGACGHTMYGSCDEVGLRIIDAVLMVMVAGWVPS